MFAFSRALSVTARQAPAGAVLGRRAASSSSSSSPRLPFEKPLFDSPLLDRAREETKTAHKIEMYTNILIIGLVASVTARVGYYAVNGKPSGADPLPRL
ncbi:hypothetical protein I4F81_000554 [Pyropia yezoensis]|uniref:Uncharacterized protein n=1 Tax=Pyropia yezoensis TaxID=2788 RepID=A0ACC3BJ21_PYRYE|nr:hypothetical protein I4F81_000554 [Neopyropia yezoensis]